jgi:O-antigen/teichoic acid export membrane protein
LQHEEEEARENEGETIPPAPGKSVSTPSVDPNFRTRNVSRGLGSLAIQNVITSILAFVFLAVLLRLTSPTDYTAYSSVLVSIGVGVTVSTFALQFAAARYIAMYSVEDEKKAWAYAKSIFLLSLIFSLAATIVFELISPELSMYFMKSTQCTFLFELGGIWLFGYSFSSVLQGIIQGMKKYSLLAKMLTISRVAMLGFAIGTLEITHNVDFAIISWILYYLILILWPAQKIYRYLFQGFENNYYSEVMRYSYPLAIATILGIVSSSGDSIVIGGYTNYLGAYNTAILISSTLSLVLVSPIITTLLPEAAFSYGKNLEASNVLRLGIRFLILGLLPVSLFMAALSKQLLLVFSGSGSYLSAQGALEVISATYLLFGMQSIIYSFLQAIGKTTEALIAGITAAATDVGLSILFIPSLGMIGAAASRTLEALVGMSVSLYFVSVYLKDLDAGIFYAKGIISSGIPSLGVFLLSTYLNDSPITLILYSLIWIFGFLICIKATKILTKEDRTFIAHVLPLQLQKFLDYL